MDELLTRGVEKIYPSREALAERLKQGPLKLYHGIDPTAPTLHLGHLATLLKLRDFQQVGHEVVILFGGLTATIGDPTDKLAARKMLSIEEVEKNLADYKNLISKILNQGQIIFKNNLDWYGVMTVPDFLGLTTKITVQQSLKRDMFKKREKAGKDIYLNELIYPLLHGYDSVVLGVDLEIGGNDQTFNMLIGRDLMKKIKNQEKFVLTTKLLVDAAGKKMGKTEGNTASLNGLPPEIFGQIMSWPDELMPLAFEILTRLPRADYEKLLTSHPKEAKLALATEVVGLVSNQKSAQKAKENFEKVFAGGESLPADIPTIKVKSGEILAEVLLANNLIASKSEFNRLVKGGGVEVVGTGKVKDEKITITKPVALKLGKHRFVQINLK